MVHYLHGHGNQDNHGSVGEATKRPGKMCHHSARRMSFLGVLLVRLALGFMMHLSRASRQVRQVHCGGIPMENPYPIDLEEFRSWLLMQSPRAVVGVTC